MRALMKSSAVLACALCALLLAPAARGADTAPELLLILDASGSMWGQIQKEAKITIARRVLRDVLAQVPAEAGVGLVAYGHRSKSDCSDIEAVIEPGSKDRAALMKAVESIQPKGKTPITKSIENVVEILRQRETASTVVLISDGIETCGGDPCKVVRQARESGIKFILHVVGFDLGDADVSQLECAAQAGGGLYLTAQNADELGAALNQAVTLTPETPAGRLSVKTTADGKLTDTMLTIANADTGEPITATRTYTGAETNPRVLPLPDGKYDVHIRAVTISGAPEQELKGVEIRDGKTVEKTVDFGTGLLRVKVTRNGKLSDATVNAYRSGTSEREGGGRTYTSREHNPKEIRLPSGTYDVVIESVEISSKPGKRWDGVKVGGSEPAELIHDFSSGILRIGATSGGQLVDAAVSVTAAGSKQHIAGGRTYTAATSNPKAMEVPPGEYTVKVQPVKMKAEAVTFEVKVEADATVERTADFKP